MVQLFYGLSTWHPNDDCIRPTRILFQWLWHLYLYIGIVQWGESMMTTHDFFYFFEKTVLLQIMNKVATMFILLRTA